MRYVGQENDAATAAGQAAKDRAEQSSWPPTEADFKAVGAAAGAAAGAVIGGPVGAAIGGVVGSVVGGAVYTLGDAIANGLDPNAGNAVGPEFARNAQRVASSPKGVAEDIARKYGTTIDIELDALRRWGVPIDSDGMATDWRRWLRFQQSGHSLTWARQQVTAWQKKLFAGTAARVAELETVKQQEQESKGGAGVGTAVVAVAGVGGVVWLIRKLISRGKF